MALHQELERIRATIKSLEQDRERCRASLEAAALRGDNVEAISWHIETIERMLNDWQKTLEQLSKL